MKRFNNDSSQQGRSMIEMLGVLAIVGVLSVAGIAGYSKAMSKYKTAKAVEQVYQIVTELQRMFGSQYGYRELQVDALDKAKDFGAIPEEMYKGGTVVNAFGGGVSLTTAEVNGRANGGFVLTFSDLPKEGTIALARVDWDAGSNTLVNIELNADIPTTAGLTSGAAPSISVSDLSGLPDSGNSISWAFR